MEVGLQFRGKLKISFPSPSFFPLGQGLGEPWRKLQLFLRGDPLPSPEGALENLSSSQERMTWDCLSLGTASGLGHEFSDQCQS